MINPDTPTNQGDFTMHTYQQNQPQFNSFYYGGMGMAPQFQPDSRRNDPTMQQPPMNYGCGYNPQNPMGSFQALYANQAYAPTRISFASSLPETTFCTLYLNTYT